MLSELSQSKIPRAGLTCYCSINAAGIVTDEPFLTTSDKNLSSTFNVNVRGIFLVILSDADSVHIVRGILPGRSGLCQCDGAKMGEVRKAKAK